MKMKTAQKALDSIIDLIYKYKQRIQSTDYHLSQKDIVLLLMETKFQEIVSLHLIH